MARTLQDPAGDGRVPEPAPRYPVELSLGEPLVVWRTWVLGRETAHGSADRPLLLGLFGFPWRHAELDAKCTRRERAAGDLGFTRATIDRHHPVIPAPECTCGIYASRDALSPGPARLLPPERPIVTGFVELSGRVLLEPDSFRAQRARIRGPLTIQPGRPGAWAAWRGRRHGGLLPGSVVVDRSGFRVRWDERVGGVPWNEWHTTAAMHLELRYGIPVIA